MRDILLANGKDFNERHAVEEVENRVADFVAGDYERLAEIAARFLRGARCRSFTEIHVMLAGTLLKGPAGQRSAKSPPERKTDDVDESASARQPLIASYRYLVKWALNHEDTVLEDQDQRFTLSQTAKALADDLVRCADLIDSSASPEFFGVIAFQLSRAGLHVSNAVRAAERGTLNDGVTGVPRLTEQY